MKGERNSERREKVNKYRCQNCGRPITHLGRWVMCECGAITHFKMDKYGRLKKVINHLGLKRGQDQWKEQEMKTIN